jgi:hypothetical protein
MNELVSYFLSGLASQDGVIFPTLRLIHQCKEQQNALCFFSVALLLTDFILAASLVQTQK